jgi:ribonuclease-3
VVESFQGQIEHALENTVDFKSELQERLARRAEVVDYEIASEEGPPHDRRFVALALVEGEELGRGDGKTKKAAEQSAAERALERLDEETG